MEIKNYVENAVITTAREQTANDKHISHCKRCFMDVVVYALNKLKPMYAVSDEGYIFTEVKLDSTQMKAEITVAVLEGIKKVKEHPHHT